jgi:hypothetical protein
MLTLAPRRHKMVSGTVIRSPGPNPGRRRRAVPKCKERDVRYGCVTDYDAVYASNNYAHSAGSASFHLQAFGRRLLREVAALTDHRSFLDIGGGNGALAAALGDLGAQCFTLDAQDREAEGYRRVDLSVFDAAAIRNVLDAVRGHIGDRHVATCFDVAEHIDLEHLSGFLLNLNALTRQDLIISISTRPSSMGNRYHSTILPRSSWIDLLALAGFDVHTLGALEGAQSGRVFSEASENLWAVSHWQRLDPFRDGPRHQAYLLCRKRRQIADTAAFAREVETLVDIGYRIRKRGRADLPLITYHAAFGQDWPFLRSLLEAWPAERIHVILRRRLLVEPVAHLVQNYLARVNVRTFAYDGVEDGVASVRESAALGSRVLVNCTEGPPYPSHLAAAEVTASARSEGMRTLCVQHGLTATAPHIPGAGTYWVWGPEFLPEHPMAPDAGTVLEAGGSPKLLDAQLDQGADAFAFRLGDWTRLYSKKVLIGLSLHWSAVARTEEQMLSWIRDLAAAHPDILFVLRPHPEDASVFGWNIDRPNIVILDDLALICMDWPVARLVRAVDLVVSVPSTLLLDALAAGTPYAVYGEADFSGPMTPLLEALLKSAHRVGDRILPQHFDANSDTPPWPCLETSLSFLDRLAEFAAGRDAAATEPPCPTGSGPMKDGSASSPAFWTASRRGCAPSRRATSPPRPSRTRRFRRKSRRRNARSPTRCAPGTRRSPPCITRSGFRGSTSDPHGHGTRRSRRADGDAAGDGGRDIARPGWTCAADPGPSGRCLPHRPALGLSRHIDRSRHMILCAGEALIDMLPRRTAEGEDAFAPHAGGAVFNTAVALGRLGAEAGYFGGLSTDFMGELLAARLADSRVDTHLCVRSRRPTTLAFVRLVDGQASYAFYDEGTAGGCSTPPRCPPCPTT